MLTVILVLMSAASLVGGAVVMVGGPFAGAPGGPLAAVLAGLAFIAGAVCVLALLTLTCLGLARPAVRFGQLHLRLLRAVS